MKKILSFLPCLIVAVSAHAGKMMEISPAERGELMKAAQVWKDSGPISQKDLLNGPSRKFSLFQHINCKFYDSYYVHAEDTGKTEKFWCAPEGSDPNQDEIKVKYDTANGEVFGDVVSSRLIWALGFFADSALPISVSCENCPKEPWRYLNYMAYYQGKPSSLRPVGQDRDDSKNQAAIYLEDAQKDRRKKNEDSLSRTGQPYRSEFEIALSEKKFKGTPVTVPGDTKAGVGLNELGQIDESKGGSSKAQVDALRLLAAFIKHGDNKAENQRLVCSDENIITKADGKQSCSHPYVVLQDVGSTMGNGVLTILGVDLGPVQKSKMSFRGWRDTPVWKDAANCVAKLGDNLVGGTLSNPRISEAGRKFLADQMMQLTDRQLNDMFTAARVDRRTKEEAASVEQWVELFKSKRAEIVNAHCPQ